MWHTYVHDSKLVKFGLTIPHLENYPTRFFHSYIICLWLVYFSFPNSTYLLSAFFFLTRAFKSTYGKNCSRNVRTYLALLLTCVKIRCVDHKVFIFDMKFVLFFEENR